MTLLEFYESTVEGKEIFPEGLPKFIAPPEWGLEGPDDMATCNRDVFTPFSKNVAAINLDEVMYSFNCIGFMGLLEAFYWIPVWMCASYYALTLEDYNPNTEAWTTNQLVRSLENDAVPVPITAIESFMVKVLGIREDNEEIYAALESFKVRRKSEDSKG